MSQCKTQAAGLNDCYERVMTVTGQMQAVAEVQRRYPEGVPLLSPEEDMSVKDSAFRKAQRCGPGVPPP